MSITSMQRQLRSRLLERFPSTNCIAMGLVLDLTHLEYATDVGMV